MDDIRRPQQPQRRDYTTPTTQRQPQAQPHQPVHQQPQHKTPAPQHHQPEHQQPQYQPEAQPYQPTQPQVHHQQHQTHQQPQHQTQPVHHQAHQPESHHHSTAAHQQPAESHQQYRSPSQIAAAQQAQHHKPAKTKKSPILKIITVIVAVITAASLLYFGYSLRSSTSGNSISQKIIQQAPFTVYFPSPMPPGYTYMKDTATFQIGQVFFKFSNGANKRVTVNEQPLPDPTPRIDLPGYTVFKSSVGQASVGATFGVSAGEVIAGKTLITLNTSGGVSQDELKAAINNLKVIGLSSDKKQ